MASRLAWAASVERRMRPQTSSSQAALNTPTKELNLRLSAGSTTGVCCRFPLPSALICGKSSERAIPTPSRACSTRATALRRSRLFSRAVSTSSCRAGSSKISHQGRSAREAAMSGPTRPRYASGDSSGGRS